MNKYHSFLFPQKENEQPLLQPTFTQDAKMSAIKITSIKPKSNIIKSIQEPKYRGRDFSINPIIIHNTKKNSLNNPFPPKQNCDSIYKKT